MQEMWVWSPGWEDALEKEMATCSSILAWEIPWIEEPCGSDTTEWLNNNNSHNDPTHPVVYKIQKDRVTSKDLTCCEMKEWDWVPGWPMLSGPAITEDLQHLPLLTQDEEWKGKERDHSPPRHCLWVLVGHLIVRIILISTRGLQSHCLRNDVAWK